MNTRNTYNVNDDRRPVKYSRPASWNPYELRFNGINALAYPSRVIAKVRQLGRLLDRTLNELSASNNGQMSRPARKLLHTGAIRIVMDRSEEIPVYEQELAFFVAEEDDAGIEKTTRALNRLRERPEVVKEVRTSRGDGKIARGADGLMRHGYQLSKDEAARQTADKTREVFEEIIRYMEWAKALLGAAENDNLDVPPRPQCSMFSRFIRPFFGDVYDEQFDLLCDVRAHAEREKSIVEQIDRQLGLRTDGAAAVDEISEITAATSTDEISQPESDQPAEPSDHKPVNSETVAD